MPQVSDSGVVPFDQLMDTTIEDSFFKYRCPPCGKQFYDKAVFRKHYMIHSGEKPYACPHCDYRAIQRVSLRMHLKRWHSEISNTLY